MGKKQKRNRRSTSAPQSSTNTTPTTNNPIHNRKLEINKSRCRSSKKIKKLFDQLRNESQSLSSISLDTSNTVIELSGHNLNNNGMVTPVKITTSTPEPSLIIIKDEDELITNNRPCTGLITSLSYLNSSPMHCSTPIAPKTNTVLREVNSTHTSKVKNGELLHTANNQIVNLTREINKDDFLTIDLTEDSTLNGTNFNKSQVNTVIDLANTTDHDCAQISPNSSVSMSGDSDVTVLQQRKKVKSGKQLEKFVNGIAKLSSTDRGKLLEMIAQKVFTGTNSASNSLPSVKSLKNCATVTEEDVYIKEVILGQAPSGNSIGSNIYNPERDIKNKSGLRMIVIDGSNVAMQHSQGRVFSVKGLKICIDYFLRRGHIVKAFVPRFRCKLGKSTDGKLLDSLERLGFVVYTPSREVQGRLINSYDDRYIVQCAAEFDAVIVSGDNYRDLLEENPRWRFVIENRLLQFTWVGDMIMFPRDPLGRTGPTLEQFLRHPVVEQHPQVL